MTSSLAVFIPSLDGGGAERVMLNLADGFAAQGVNVSLVLVKAEGPYLSQVSSKVELVTLGSRQKLLLSFPDLINYLRREQPVAMLCGQEDANIVALWAKQLMKVSTQMVAIVHNHLSRDAQTSTLLKRQLTPHLVRWFYPWADKIVAVSQGVAEDLVDIGLPKDKIKAIYNPVVTPELHVRAREKISHPWFAPDQPPVIMGAGRLENQKDFSTLIRAVAKLQQQRPVRLMILGEGTKRPELEALIGELGLTDSVAMPGFVSNPYAYMARASVFVLSSIWEGFGNVLVEAIAVGTPVVSTDCKSGPAEILENGKYGKLVAVGDVTGMAEAIAQTLDYPPAPTELQRRAERFSTAKVLAEYRQILQITE
ncbi:MAG: D-inositol-3-phosphate glycosyltransferase [Chroococcidiopsis cubana SAG 39.79]|jgi:glycosyltransferase involved in cell wall biosynthesis|uniref:Glycosyl transferase n=1 Tax=Chroococcidiopsis cubana SAG 39.79 TaxID=388085 RepID=A0AB37UJV1_9CYAN|nr:MULTISPECIES: glycosyltransferase [Chroococcidiopsis]PSB45181.1 glycosyl transferase [Cyanosarcina cf. burmensis CCALA 770]MDZ4875427.1 D-inositol-3-phosphate glycosyltransferase [Chroococcidiopsis cubana SAG 39.79]PSB63572.1 glycosyl transferase [Chroococcidiopsis cubana CCALA 043]RUT11644.1 glycosyl transferase [Chroococcidiopsis cubana SAG 39.79]URD52791.1 glycosyltransferase [Chroococcidiopsis sp. CCNUC1]